jgi:isomerase DpgB
MVNDGRITRATDPAQVSYGLMGAGDHTVWIDGARPLSAESVAAIATVCDGAEDRAGAGPVVVHVSGVPGASWARDVNVALVSKWERGLRRLERLPAATIGVASGDCGGTALDALLATDYRIAASSVRLLVPAEAGATWPGMVLYRLCHGAGAGEAAIRRAVLFGAPIDAGDALTLGLIDELAQDPLAAVAAAAEFTAAFSGAELAIRRQLMLDARMVSFEDALGHHLAACDRELRRLSAGVTR